MANVKITELTAYTNPASTDVVPIVDLVNDQTKKVTLADIFQTFPDGSESAPSIAFDSDSNTGIYRAAADKLGFSTGGTARVTINASAVTSALPVDVLLGSASTPSFTFTGDLDTGIYSPGANQVAVSTAGTGRLFIDSSGNLGIGTPSPSVLLHIASSEPQFYIQDTNSTGNAVNATFQFRDSSNTQLSYFGFASGSDSDLSVFNTMSGGALRFGTASTERMRIDSSGNIGINRTDPNQRLCINGNAEWNAYDGLGGSGGYYTLKGLIIGNAYDAGKSTGDDRNAIIWQERGLDLVFATDDTERMRIDSSGRLLVGTSSESGNARTVVRGNSGSSTGAGVLDIGLGTTRPGSASTPLGYLRFTSTSNTASNYHYAAIHAETDGTSTSDADIPGRLVFSTTADGASSPTDRIIINAQGTIYPATDNTYQAGSSGYRWTAIYAVNGTIQTSDARQKTDVFSCSLGSSFIKSLKPVSYKWIDGGNVVTKSEDGENDVVTPVPGERTHWGFLAQDVKAAIDEAGVVFGGWILTDKDDSNSTQGLRYDQFIAPLTKALQEAIAKIETLEAKVAALEAG